MSKRQCCVVTCPNKGDTEGVKFYAFPKVAHKLLQRQKWIEAIRKVNKPDWTPDRTDRICSAHFFGNAKAEEVLSPSYAPAIFSSSDQHKNEAFNEIAARIDRFLKRQGQQHLEEIQSSEDNTHYKSVFCDRTNVVYDQENDLSVRITFYDECLVENFLECYYPVKETCTGFQLIPPENTAHDQNQSTKSGEKRKATETKSGQKDKKIKTEVKIQYQIRGQCLKDVDNY